MNATELELAKARKMNKFQDTIARLNMVIVDRDTELSCSKKESDRRLRLLWLANDDRVITGNRCPICKKLPEMVAIVNAEYKYKDNHESGCELAEEIGDR